MKLPRPELLVNSDMRFIYKHDSKVFKAKPRTLYRYRYETTFRQIVNIFRCKHFDGNEKILDVGCAQGILTLTLSAYGHNTVGLDLRRSFLKYAKMKAEKREKKCSDFICANAYRLPFKLGVFNCVVLGAVLEHLSKPEMLMLEVKKVLKQTGYCVITVPNGERLTYKRVRTYWGAKGLVQTDLEKLECKPTKHVFEFTKNELYRLLIMCGFRPENFRYSSFVGYVLLFYLRLPIPVSWLRKIEHVILNLPLIRKKFASMLICVCVPFTSQET